MAVLDSDLLAEFLDEAEEGVATLNEDLLLIEDELNQGLNINSESLNDMFRIAHSIKGASSFFNLTKTNSLTHELESLMDLFRSGILILTKEHTNLIFKVLDLLSKLFADIKKEGTEKTDISGILSEIKEASSVNAKQKIQTSETNKEFLIESTPIVDKSSNNNEGKVSDYLNEFIVETEDNITSLNDSLLSLEVDPANENELHSSFRLSHTIKGSAGLLGYSEINKLMHALEDLLSMVRAKKFVLNSKLISFCFKIVDHVERAMKNLKNNGEEGIDTNDVLTEFKAEVSKMFLEAEYLEDSDDNKQKTQKQEIQIQKQDGFINNSENTKLYKVSVYIDFKTSLKSVRAMLIKKKLSELGNVLDINPAIDKIDSMDVDENFAIIYTLQSNAEKKDILSCSNVDTVQKVIVDLVPEEVEEQTINNVMNVESINGSVEIFTGKQIDENIKKKVSIIQTVRVDIKKLDNLMNLAGELVITKAVYGQLLMRLQKYMVNVTEQMSQLTNLLNMFDNLGSSNKDTVGDKIQELNKDVKTVQHMINSDDFSSIMADFDDNTSRLGKISGEIQSDVMLARMVPIYGVFNRFKRVIRDLSVELKKDVKLEIYGEETELDKKIIDEISDPLTHMVRNAMDHGFESVDARVANGKNSYGTLKLEASHKGNSVYVSVSDDGKGIDPEKVAEKALSKGIITPEKREMMTDKEKINLVFLPGFSLAEQVTSLSGRGVGMDVVVKMVENVGGSVSIDSELGSGTTVSIKIPLTLAIIKALLVNISNQLYAFPLDTVIEVVKISDEEIYSIDGNRTIKLRGAPVALLNLKKLIDIDSESKIDKNTEGDKVTIVIISDGSTHLGVSVDSLIGSEEIVIKSLSDHFSEVVGVSGASILGNGAIAQILDVGAIIKAAE